MYKALKRIDMLQLYRFSLDFMHTQREFSCLKKNLTHYTLLPWHCFLSHSKFILDKRFWNEALGTIQKMYFFWCLLADCIPDTQYFVIFVCVCCCFRWLVWFVCLTDWLIFFLVGRKPHSSSQCLQGRHRAFRCYSCSECCADTNRSD